MIASVDLATIFLVMPVGGVASFGGGMGPVAITQGTGVTGGQLDAALFARVLASSHLTPGPRAAFIAGVGCSTAPRIRITKSSA